MYGRVQTCSLSSLSLLGRSHDVLFLKEINAFFIGPKEDVTRSGRLWLVAVLWLWCCAPLAANTPSPHHCSARYYHSIHATQSVRWYFTSINMLAAEGRFGNVLPVLSPLSASYYQLLPSILTVLLLSTRCVRSSLWYYNILNIPLLTFLINTMIIGSAKEYPHFTNLSRAIPSFGPISQLKFCKNNHRTLQHSIPNIYKYSNMLPGAVRTHSIFHSRSSWFWKLNLICNIDYFHLLDLHQFNQLYFIIPHTI